MATQSPWWDHAPAFSAPRLDGRQRELLLRLSVAVGEDEPAEPRSSLEQMQERLFRRRAATGAGAAEGEPLDDSVHLLAAAGESMEAVEIARLVQQAVAAGIRPGEVGVLLRDPVRYAAPLASAFERAGIEAFFVEGEPRVDPAARGLGLMLGGGRF